MRAFLAGDFECFGYEVGLLLFHDGKVFGEVFFFFNFLNILGECEMYFCDFGPVLSSQTLWLVVKQTRPMAIAPNSVPPSRIQSSEWSPWLFTRSCLCLALRAAGHLFLSWISPETVVLNFGDQCWALVFVWTCMVCLLALPLRCVLQLCGVIYVGFVPVMNLLC